MQLELEKRFEVRLAEVSMRKLTFARHSFATVKAIDSCEWLDQPRTGLISRSNVAI